MKASESKIAIIKCKIMKILAIKIHTIFYDNRKKPKKWNSLIPFSLTTVSSCKYEWNILITDTLYSDDIKVVFNE